MRTAVDFPCTLAGLPTRMSGARIAEAASGLRHDLFGLAVKPIEVEALVRKLRQLVINGGVARIMWDIDHAVHDEEGRPALGACEHDPDVPRTVLISLNRELLVDQPALMRSTAAHELGHAIFDMPSAFGRNARRVFRTMTTPAIARPGAPINWAEWRADEFMGAFLVPPDRLWHAVARQAGLQGLPFRWRANGRRAPHPIIEVDPADPALNCLTDDLAETFGVSPAFMAVRLRKAGAVLTAQSARR